MCSLDFGEIACNKYPVLLLLNSMFGGWLGLGLVLIILGTLSRYHQVLCAQNYSSMLTFRHSNHSLKAKS